MSNGNVIIFQGDGNDKKMNIYKRDRSVEQRAVAGTTTSAYDGETTLINMSYTVNTQYGNLINKILEQKTHTSNCKGKKRKKRKKRNIGNIGNIGTKEQINIRKKIDV